MEHSAKFMPRILYKQNQRIDWSTNEPGSHGGELPGLLPEEVDILDKF